MKLWLAIHWMMDCGSSILGIYDNEEDAKDREARYRETQQMGRFEGTRIEEYELGRDYLSGWEITLSTKGREE